MEIPLKICGDFYGFSVKNDGTYFISYWYHESILNQQIHLVADDFPSFIMAISENANQNFTSNDSSVDQHTTPPKMIELLKKTGKWKGD